jgi:hypothetical protein
MNVQPIRACVVAAAIAFLLSACTDKAVAVGADRDTHGCIGSAGYAWCEHTQRCERPWELAKQKGFDATEAHFARYCSTGSAE